MRRAYSGGRTSGGSRRDCISPCRPCSPFLACAALDAKSRLRSLGPLGRSAMTNQTASGAGGRTDARLWAQERRGSCTTSRTHGSGCLGRSSVLGHAGGKLYVRGGRNRGPPLWLSPLARSTAAGRARSRLGSSCGVGGESPPRRAAHPRHPRLFVLADCVPHLRVCFPVSHWEPPPTGSMTPFRSSHMRAVSPSLNVSTQ